MYTNYKLIIRQTPLDIQHPLKCEKKFVEPTPIIQLVNTKGDNKYMSSAYLYLKVKLITNNSSIILSGGLNQSIYKLKDFNMEEIGLFIFNDLQLTNLNDNKTCKCQLQFTLYDIQNDMHIKLTSIYTNEFEVSRNIQSVKMNMNLNNKLNDYLSSQGMKLKTSNYFKRKRSISINNNYTLINNNKSTRSNSFSYSNVNNMKSNPLSINNINSMRSHSFSTINMINMRPTNSFSIHSNTPKSNSFTWDNNKLSNSICYNNTMNTNCSNSFTYNQQFNNTNSHINSFVADKASFYQQTPPNYSRSSSVASIKDHLDYSDFSKLFDIYLKKNKISLS